MSEDSDLQTNDDRLRLSPDEEAELLAMLCQLSPRVRASLARLLSALDARPAQPH